MQLAVGGVLIVLVERHQIIIIIIIIIIPIVIPSTGVIRKSLSQSLTTLNLHPNTYIQLQKSAILGTCSIVRNFLINKTTEPNHVDLQHHRMGEYFPTKAEK